jgi:hypothetical protein
LLPLLSILAHSFNVAGAIPKFCDGSLTLRRNACCCRGYSVTPVSLQPSLAVFCSIVPQIRLGSCLLLCLTAYLSVTSLWQSYVMIPSITVSAHLAPPSWL